MNRFLYMEIVSSLEPYLPVELMQEPLPYGTWSLISVQELCALTASCPHHSASIAYNNLSQILFYDGSNQLRSKLSL